MKGFFLCFIFFKCQVVRKLAERETRDAKGGGHNLKYFWGSLKHHQIGYQNIGWAMGISPNTLGRQNQ